jgi:hypothetical protein
VVVPPGKVTGSISGLAGIALACVLAGLLWTGARASSPGYALQLDGVDDEARVGSIAGTGGQQTVEV